MLNGAKNANFSAALTIMETSPNCGTDPARGETDQQTSPSNLFGDPMPPKIPRTTSDVVLGSLPRVR